MSDETVTRDAYASKNKLILISTQIEVVVEIEVELGNRIGLD